MISIYGGSAKTGPVLLGNVASKQPVTVSLCGVLHSRQIVDEQDVCSLLESNLVVAQGQRRRAGRDTSIQIRLIENLSDLRRPMRNGVAGRALEAFPGFPHGISHASRNRLYTRP
jgi:hypothetical protein